MQKNKLSSFIDDSLRISLVYLSSYVTASQKLVMQRMQK